MKLIDAAIQILKEKNQPMKTREIWKEIEERQLFITSGKTPVQTLNTQLLIYCFGSGLKRVHSNPLFYKSAPGVYGLLEWLDNNQIEVLRTEEEISKELIAEEILSPLTPNADLLNTDLFLEKEWHQWLYKNLIENGLIALGFGELSLFDSELQDNEKNIGKYNTRSIGEIDLLLKNENKEIVVIELKRAASDQTIGQICRYVGWVEENLSKGNKVYGIIIAQKIDDQLRYAIKPIKEHIFYQQLRMKVEFGESSRKTIG